VNDTTHLTQLSAHLLGLINHIQLVRQVMRLFTTRFERLPMVCFLLGQLFIAVGLYLGLEHSLALVSIVAGCGGCVFGVVLYMLQLLERPKKSEATRLSPKFISAGATVMMPAMPNVENEQATKQSAVE
jgi:hypothetical protein